MGKRKCDPQTGETFALEPLGLKDDRSACLKSLKELTGDVLLEERPLLLEAAPVSRMPASSEGETSCESFEELRERECECDVLGEVGESVGEDEGKLFVEVFDVVRAMGAALLSPCWPREETGVGAMMGGGIESGATDLAGELGTLPLGPDTVSSEERSSSEAHGDSCT